MAESVVPRRSLVIMAVALAGLSATGCGEAREPCSAFNCEGCCYNGGCFVGTTSELCGAGGSACVTCEDGLACVEASCVAEGDLDAAVSADGASPDGHAGDAGAPGDVGPIDASRTDAAGLDAALGDTGPMDSGTADAGAPPDSGIAVTGTRVIHYVTDTGDVDVASDLRSASISAFTGSGAAMVEWPGVGRADGTFEIPDVPPGPYVLAFNSAYVVSSARHLDLGQYLLGRPNAGRIVTPTEITFDCRSIEPWTANSQLTAYSSNSYASGSALVPMAPASGATGVTFTRDWSTLERAAPVDPALGDELILAQFSFRTAPVSHWAMTSAATVFGASIQSGVAASYIASFAPLTQTTLELDWRIPEFDSLAPLVSPGGVFTEHRLYIDPIPGTYGRGHFGNGPILGYVGRPPGAAFAMSFLFGNPYPGTLISPAYIGEIEVTYQLPGATPLVVPATLRQGDALSAFDGVPLAPRLFPPSQTRVNNQLASLDHTGAGTQPLVSWRAPLSGTPDFYTVAVYELRSSGGATVDDRVATLYTSGTSLELPPGILTAGHTYYFVISAVVAGGIDVELTPFLRAYPDIVMPSYSGVISP